MSYSMKFRISDTFSFKYIFFIAGPYQQKHLNEPPRNHLAKPVKDPASSPSASFFKNLWRRNRSGNFFPQRYDQHPPPTLSRQGE